nr:hypothetical protein [Escherichia coli O25b:H4-ST131]
MGAFDVQGADQQAQRRYFARLRACQPFAEVADARRSEA